MANVGVKLTISKYGKPEEVVNLENDTVGDPKENEVLLTMLIAPVNPVDINFIEGKYAFQQSLPTVPGAEGVAKVVKIGPNVKKLQVGDHVIPLNCWGNWKTFIISCENNWLAIPKNLGLPEAAMLSINPPTVYKMLKDFVNLSSGDTVIQNGANSACGQIVIQMCRIWGITTVNIVRDRPDIDVLKNFLINLGATYVFTEAEIKNINLFNLNKVRRPKLALNCVGGQNANNILRHLDFDGLMITYGGMSKHPVSIPTSALIFKGIEIKGFNILKAMNSMDENEQRKMFNEICSMYLQGLLIVPPYIIINYQNYKNALANTITVQGMIGKKFLLQFHNFNSKL